MPPWSCSSDLCWTITCGSIPLAIALLIIHGLVAVALLGAITHQTLATWAPAGAPAASFLRRFRAVPSASFANVIVLLYVVSALLGATLYLYFRVDVRPELDRGGHWPAPGLFDLREHFISIRWGLVPADWVCWRRPLADAPGRIRAVLTAVLAFIVWWSFLIGHVMNNIMGFRS